MVVARVLVEQCVRVQSGQRSRTQPQIDFPCKMPHSQYDVPESQLGLALKEDCAILVLALVTGCMASSPSRACGRGRGEYSGAPG